MFRFGLQVGDWYLMRAPCAFYRLAVNKFRPGPAFRTAQANHRPGGPLRGSADPGFALNESNFIDNGIESGRHRLMHRFRLMPLHEVRFVSITREQLSQILITEAA